MNYLNQLNLTLFFTNGTSLQLWDRVGILDRELELYRRLLPHLKGVTFVTCGNAGDLDYVKSLAGIKILCNKWNLPLSLYTELIPWLHAASLRDSDIFKTNQLSRGNFIRRAASWHKKPLIARCGYLWADFVAKNHGHSSWKAKIARHVEFKIFHFAAYVVVTTKTMKQKIIMDYGVRADKITVIPNYVRTDLFFPRPELREPATLCFVGRLNEQKNPIALLEAITGLPVKLIMIGDGKLRPQVEQAIAKYKLKVELIEQVPHCELPNYLNRASLFVLPSHYEGHPKALIEAMSCGLPIVATNVGGIKELVSHSKTAYLCSPTADSLRKAIKEIIGSPHLQSNLGRRSLEFAQKFFSLDSIVEKELSLLNLVASESPYLSEKR